MHSGRQQQQRQRHQQFAIDVPPLQQWQYGLESQEVPKSLLFQPYEGILLTAEQELNEDG